MNPSIRRYLLLHLLLGVTVITALMTLANYYFDEKAIGSHLDNWLSQSSLTFKALISDDLNHRDAKKVQKLINKIPKEAEDLYEKASQHHNPYQFKENFQFQVWDNNGHILLRSPNSPKLPISNGVEGFSNREIDHQPWRVFTLYDEKTGVSIVTAERFDIRHRLGNQIAHVGFYIVLFCSPLIAVLIWVIVGRGLNSIRRVTEELRQREAHFLDPLPTHAVPVEIKPLVDELNHLFLRLVQSFEREQAFSSNAAHELRTPMAVLKAQAQVALKTEETHERKVALQKLLLGVDRSTHVVEQLLTLSRLSPETTLQNRQKVDLSKVATETIALLAPTAITKNIEIALLGSQKKHPIWGDGISLGILIRNLVDNAIRYTPPDGEVVISLVRTKKRVILKVEDNGPGISPELRARVFERFYRVLGTKASGSGLGLAIVQQIAELHEATVTLGTPETHSGLEVLIEFPIYKKV